MMNKQIKNIIAILCCLLFFVISTVYSVSCISNITSQNGGQGTLNLADTGPVTLDPALTTEVDSASYIFQIFSGLVKLDDDMHITPDIAQSWFRSNDGLTYTFYLRKDVTFHDGKSVTASDFIYSWERALNPFTGSLSAGAYLNDIAGAIDILTGKASSLSGVKAIDNYTLEIKITSPIPYFLEKLAYPTAFVVDKTNVRSGSTWWQNPNGTGPFKLSKWQKDQILVLSRNDNYYGEKAILSQVVFQLYSGDPMQLYEEGTIDVAYVSSPYAGLVTDPENSISKELNIYPELSVYYLGFNTTEPPFDDVNVRLAFCYAVDKERLIELSTGATVTPAYGILPEDMPGYDSSFQGLTFDPEKARELIASSKYGNVANLPPVVFTTAGWGGDISGLVGGVIEEWRRNLGIEVTVRQIEPDYFTYNLNQELNNLYDYGWIADYPDPQDFLDILFRTGQSNNIGGYSNSQLDSLLDRASIEQDSNSRLSMYQQAEQIVIGDAAVLPLFFSRNYILTKPYVKGYELSPLGFASLSRVSIER
jgi:oligopeptide transport system substrate-binding protein